jgi:HAD superfamily phosphoserine phosphatase-like hydrolase
VRLLAGGVLLSPLIALYKLGLVSGSPLRVALAYVCFRGCREEEVRRLGERYASTLGTVLRSEMLERLRWHRANGHTVVVVSASLAVYLRPFCESVGADLIAAELAACGGILTGKYRGGDCTGREKARRVAERYDLASYELIWAYGDTAEDEALLGLAHRRFFRGREVTPSALSVRV